MCCLPCYCAFKLQLVPVLALGLVRAPGYEQHLLLLLLLSLLRAADAISYGCACSANSGCCFCNSMCCLSCSCAFKLQLVPLLALGLVRAPGYEQHLLLLLLLSLLRAADAISYGCACSANSGCCFCNSMCCLSCSCAFKLQLVPVLALGLVRALGLWAASAVASAAASAAVSVKELLMQFHMDVLAPPILDAVSAILCAACLVTARLNFNWCRFLLWVWFGL